MTVKEFYELAVKNGAENNCIFYDDLESGVWAVSEGEIYFKKNEVLISFN